MKLAILIPTTSRNRPWTKFQDTYLYNLTIRSYLRTYSFSFKNEDLETVFYIGYDEDDKLWGQETQRSGIQRFLNIMRNIRCEFISMKNIEKGYLTKMWNRLFQHAFDEGCDYFFQCGDDINFRTNEWVPACIQTLQEHNDIGLTGPMNNNSRILTQAMVSRKHMEIFGFFFPEEIKNWCCDDWYNFVYQPDFFYPLTNHLCTNDGGEERYEIDGDPKFRVFNTNKKLYYLRSNTMRLAQKHKTNILQYLMKQKES